jgi:hypothetical protein
MFSIFNFNNHHNTFEIQGALLVKFFENIPKTWRATPRLFQQSYSMLPNHSNLEHSPFQISFTIRYIYNTDHFDNEQLALVRMFENFVTLWRDEIEKQEGNTLKRCY